MTSDAMLSVLALLGETPEEHQKGREKPAKVSHPKKPPLPKGDHLIDRKAIAERWQSQSWRPLARVLFIRQTECRSCGAHFESPHWPETFIKERLVRDPKLFRYIPSRSALASSVKLPHLREVIKVKAHFCHLCPDWQEDQLPEESPECLEELLLSRLAATASGPSSGAPISSTSSEPESSFAPSKSPESGTLSMVLDWSPTSWVNCARQEGSAQESTLWGHGFSSANYAFDQFANVQLTPSRTTQDMEPVAESTTTN